MSCSLRPAKFVTLNGQQVVCGINTRNLDALRDRCELHLHMETGGVFVKMNGEETYLSPTVVAHADMVCEVREEDSPSLSPSPPPHVSRETPRASDAPGAEKDADISELPPLSREDEILAEIGHTIKAQDAAAAAAKPKGAPRRKRK